MKNKFFIFIVFLIFFVIFWNLFAPSYIHFEASSRGSNFILFHYKDIYAKHYLCQKKIDTAMKGACQTYKVKKNFKSFSFSMLKIPSTMSMNKIVIYLGPASFKIDSKDFNKYLILKNINSKLLGDYQIFNFNSRVSMVESSPLLFCLIFSLRLFWSFIFSFLLCAFFFFVFKKTDKKINPLFTSMILFYIFCFPIFSFFLKTVPLFKLKGEVEKEKVVPYSLLTFSYKFFQENCEKNIAHKLYSNVLNIKTFNTIYYYLFDRSLAYKGLMVIGKDKYLFEQRYTKQMINKEKIDFKALNSMVEDIKFIQDQYKKNNKVFFVVITPSKALYLKEYLPANYKITGFQNNVYKKFIQAFDKTGVNYIDTPSLIKNNENGHIIFAKGGIHYADYPKYIAAQAVIKKIESHTHKNINPLSIERIYKDNDPAEEDTDLAGLLNLINPPIDYSVEHIFLKKAQIKSPLVIKIVGESFSFGIIDMLNASRMFKKIDLYYYYNTNKQTFQDGTSAPVDNNFGKIRKRLIKDINSGDVIILEINQDVFAIYGEGRIQNFVNDFKNNL